MRRFEVWQINRFRIPMSMHRIHNGLPAHTLNRIFTRRINPRHKNHIRSLQSFSKFIGQLLRPAIPMRLKKNHHTPPVKSPRRLQCRRDFRRMMPIVIHHPKSFRKILRLKTPFCAREGTQRPGRFLKINPTQISNRQRTQSIQDIVQSGNPQLNAPHFLPTETHRKTHRPDLL